ncbi:hypothetical protein [Maridesulfovibrio sp.]|uniref:hypothetical protein n=1 Tax=Maridesulfovibrio sp. TaxID=2795000 RepID=UPI002A18B9EC|nr:hypothetical protein [Maridesulfovibrio sp.]
MDNMKPSYASSKKLHIITMTFITLLLMAFITGRAHGSETPSYSEKTGDAAIMKFKPATPFTGSAREKDLQPPKLADIPSSKEVTPWKADEIPPSPELKEIIEKVRNQSLPKARKPRHREDEEVSSKSLEIIRAGAKTLTAEEIQPSEALESVLQAYRNGSLAYTHRSFNPEDIREMVFYHQPYADVNLQSIFDMTVLTSGHDIFLSLGLTPLEQFSKTETETRSDKLKELRQTIDIFKARDAKESAEQLEEGNQLGSRQKQAQTDLHRWFNMKQVMDFLGIRRKDETKDNYGEMASAFRLYKQWVQRWEKMDRYVKQQKSQNIKLDKYMTPHKWDTGPSSRQLQISPYGGDLIQTLPY